MAKNKKDKEIEPNENGDLPEAEVTANGETQETTVQHTEQPRSVTEDDISIGDTQIGFKGEHITLKVDPAHPLHDKLVGRTVSLPVLFTSAE